MTPWIWLVALALAVLVLAPRLGFLSSWRRWSSNAQRVRTEDALKHILDEEYRGRRASLRSVAGALHLSDRAVMTLLDRMQKRGLVEALGQGFNLTTEGERLAIQVVRAHRLLERYLVDEARLPLTKVHGEAERREHALTLDQVNSLDASLGHPSLDPHGDPIPTREGYLAPATGTPLTSWPTATAGRIVHLEDEPPLAYAQILAEGLRVGQVVRLLETTVDRVALSDGTAEYRLAPAVAANIFVAPVSARDEGSTGLMALSDLSSGSHAEVVGLNEACQGFTRRRLLDLGFTPGARIDVDLTTFAGDPRAYRIRGTLIALRRDQASQILVRPVADTSEEATRNPLPDHAVTTGH
jgi:DtxR family Mn-dependent transcriptional regulator